MSNGEQQAGGAGQHLEASIALTSTLVLAAELGYGHDLYAAATVCQCVRMEEQLWKLLCRIEFGSSFSSALHAAAAANDVERAGQLLDMGADLHALTVNDETALHVACSRGSIAAASLLLDRGADIHAGRVHGTNEWLEPRARNDKSQSQGTSKTASPLSLACTAGHIALAVMLLDRGASPEELIVIDASDQPVRLPSLLQWACDRVTGDIMTWRCGQCKRAQCPR